MDKPLINILTRTSNRPNGFDNTVKCVKNQTYDNIKHIISYDNDNDLTYLKKYDDLSLVKINRDDLIKNDKYRNPNTGKYSPHNMYFNEMIKHVDEGWVIYLDDDDTLAHTKVIEEIVNVINKHDEDTLIFWKFKLGDNLVLPRKLDKSNPPSIGGIGGSCMTFNIKYKHLSEWDSWKCGDFRVIRKLYNGIANNIFINKVNVLAPIPGSGNKKDI
jgi:glycosyltransferase involved in cell wall biosynthesis